MTCNVTLLFTVTFIQECAAANFDLDNPNRLSSLALSPSLTQASIQEWSTLSLDSHHVVQLVLLPVYQLNQSGTTRQDCCASALNSVLTGRKKKSSNLRLNEHKYKLGAHLLVVTTQCATNRSTSGMIKFLMGEYLPNLVLSL